MKKTALIFLIAAMMGCKGNPPVHQGKSNIDWHVNLEEALNLAKKSDKSVLLEFFTEWCPYCKFIDERIFNSPRGEEIPIEKFVFVRLDGDKSENQLIMDKFGIKGFPTFIILSNNGREVSRFNDVNSAAEFSSYLLKAAPDAESPLRENKKKQLRHLNELVTKFPNSPYLPEYYKQIADAYSTEPIKKFFLREAAKYVELRISRIKNGIEGDPRLKRITLDQHIDLLADIYKELKLFHKIGDLYLTGAALCEEEVNNNGGIKNNKHMISTVAYYYLGAERPYHAIKFLKRAMDELPDYWPVYSNYAKVMIADKNPQEAVTLAKKAYEMAEDIAKPRIAMILADAHAAAENYKEAIAALKDAEADLLKTGAAESGRAKVMLEKIRNQLKEYEQFIP